jgi:hypothetical protein
MLPALNFWHALENFDKPTPATWWSGKLGNDYQLVRDKYLQPNPESEVEVAKQVELGRAQEPPIPYEPAPGVSIIPYLVKLEINWKPLSSAIAKAFGLQSKFTEVGIPSTRQIAELGDMPILLTIQSDDELFQSAVSQLVAMCEQPFVLLAPTRGHFNVKITSLLSRKNAGFFDLESHLTLSADGSLRASKTGGELFSKYLPEQKEAVSESEAVKLFALMKSLKSGPSIRKATLEQVFQFLVLDQKSQVETARLCKCSEATISARVKVIEKRMDLPIKQLRAFASRLRDIDIQKDQRAKTLNKRELVD